MKRLTLLSILLTSTLSTTVYGDGGENGGGGDTLPTTPATLADINENLRTIKDQSYAAFLRLYGEVYNGNFLGIEPTLPAEQLQQLQVLFRKNMWVLSPEELEPIFYSFTLNIKNDSSCYEQNEERDASADPVSQSICVSLPRLLARNIPYNDLSVKLSALFVHEVAHLVHISEEDALVLQTAFESLGQPTDPEHLIAYKVRELSSMTQAIPAYISVLLSSLEENDSSLSVCFLVGQMSTINSSQMSDLETSLLVLGTAIFSKDAFQRSGSLYLAIDRVAGFCGNSYTGGPAVPEGDRAALKTALLDLGKIASAFVAAILRRPFAMECPDHSDDDCYPIAP